MVWNRWNAHPLTDDNYLEHVGQLTHTFNNYYTERARSIDEDRTIEIDAKYFDEVKSSLRKSLTKTLGLDLVNRLLPAVRNKPLILGLARNNIRMLKDWCIKIVIQKTGL